MVALRNKIFALLVVAVVWAVIYVPTFEFETLHYDDVITISRNPAIRNLSDIPAIWQSFNTRFLVGLTFAINYALHGVHAQGYHVVNGLIHLFLAWLVFLLTLQLGRTPELQNRYPPSTIFKIALVCAFVFVAHPLQTEAVTFVTQRYVLLAAFFYLATLHLYLVGRLESRRRYLVGAFVAAALAMFCKEISFTLPLMLVLLERYFWGPWRVEWKKRLKILCPFLLLLAVIPLALLSTSAQTMGTTRIAHVQELRLEEGSRQTQVDITRAASPFSRREYFLTQFNVLVTYLRLFIFPVNQNLDYDYPIARNIFDGHTLASAVFLGMLLLFIWKLFEQHRLFSFGLAWFFLTLSVESSIIPIGHVIAEYRMHLAITGLALCAAVFLVKFLGQGWPFWLGAILTVMIFSTMASSRNALWGQPVALWEDTVQKSPHKSRPRINLAKWYADRGEHAKAIAHLRQALVADPLNPRIHTNWGAIVLQQGKVAEAIEHFQKAIEANAGYAAAHFNLGVAYSYQGQWDKEIECYQKALALNANFQDAIFALGEAYADLGDEKAWDQVERLEELNNHELVAQLRVIVSQKLLKD